MVVVERNKNHQFKSPVYTQRSSHAWKHEVVSAGSLQQDRHVNCAEAVAKKAAADAASAATVDPDAPNVLQTMIQLQQAKSRISPITKSADHQHPLSFSPCKGIMSCFSFMFLGVPRHYARRSFSCWCTTCSRVRVRGHGSKLSDRICVEYDLEIDLEIDRG
jgi:hypothetical protein